MRAIIILPHDCDIFSESIIFPNFLSFFMFKKLTISSILGCSLAVGFSVVSNAQGGFRGSRTTVGPFTQPGEYRCGVVAASPDGRRDLIFWGVDRRNGISACEFAVKQAASQGYRPRALYEATAEARDRFSSTPIDRRPRVIPSRTYGRERLCFAQPGESCY
ncbi:MAG: hypothetical protein F6J96_16010 [Symploca sp. SIO1C2]|nr:hypothetical protein [Symploca sp. SIO1C2]